MNLPREIEKFKREVVALGWGCETPRGPLFHYTSEAATLGILSSGVFRASNVLYLNDSDELSFGNRIVESIWQRRVETEGGIVAQWLRPFRPTLFALRDNFNIYVLSLCARLDCDIAWSRYGDRGRGYAFRFSPRRMDWSLLRVIYKRSDQEALVHRLMDLSIGFLRRVKNNPGPQPTGETLVHNVARRREEIDPYFLDTIVTVQKALAACTLRFKDPRRWRLEEEWRYVGTGEACGNREVNGISIPYQQFRICDLPVDGLVVGPAAPCSREVLDRVGVRLPVIQAPSFKEVPPARTKKPMQRHRS